MLKTESKVRRSLIEIDNKKLKKLKRSLNPYKHSYLK